MTALTQSHDADAADSHRVRVATLEAARALRVDEIMPRRPGQDEVCVAVDACGICGSDMHMYFGHHPVLRPPIVMGHEFVGRVIARGSDVTTLAIGDRVVAIAGRGCGTCPACRGGHFNWCESLQVIGGHLPGGLSDQVVLPADQFVPVPETFTTEEAALVEVAAVALHTAHRCGPIDGRSCVILGAGPVGLMVTRVVRALGAGYVAVSDISRLRRDLAAQSGADAVFDGSDSTAEAALHSVRPLGFDIVIDCVGRQETLLQALRLTRRGGTIGLAAIFAGDFTVPMLQVQRAERSLIGVQMYDRVDFDSVIGMMESGKLDLTGIVTHEYPLENVAEAFALLAAPGAAAGKILVRMRPSGD